MTNKAQLQSSVTITNISNGFIIDFTLPDYTVRDTNIYENFGINQTYSYIDIQNFGEMAEEGYPNLPQHTLNLYIPTNTTTFSVSTSNKQTQSILLSHPILPYQDFFQTDSVEFLKNTVYYNSDGSLFAFDYQISDTFDIMGARGIAFSIFPFRYNPIAGSISKTQSIRFTITHNGSFASGHGQQNAPLASGSSVKNEYLGQIFDNYPASKQNAPGLITSMYRGKYLIITAPMFENTLSYFANYKRNIGYDVTVVTTHITGIAANNIKNYLQTQYNNTSTRPDYVLLVGDVDNIPPSAGSVSGITDDDYTHPITDLDYTRLSGDDYYADIFLGRLPVSSAAQLQNIIHKTIFMETNLHRFNKHALLVAGGGNGKNSFSSNVKDVKKELENKNFTCTVFHTKDGATQADVLNALNNDNTLFIYRGHGSYTSLAAVDFSISGGSISSRTNSVFPFGFGFACLTNCFAYTAGTSFGESYVRSSVGGVSFFGASTISYRDQNNIINEKIFNQLNNNDRLSHVINKGMKEYHDRFWGFLHKEKTKRHIRMYNLLGDPSLYMFGIGCQSDYEIATNVTFHNGDQVTYEAGNSIIAGGSNSSVLLQSGSNIILKSGNKITLLPGFHAAAGSTFSALISDIDCNSPSLVRKQNNTSDTIDVSDKNNYPHIPQYSSIVTTFPNPASKYISFYFYIISQPEILYITDINGRMVGTYSLSEYKSNTWDLLTINISSLIKGTYLFTIKHKNGHETGKFIKVQ